MRNIIIFLGLLIILSSFVYADINEDLLSKAVDIEKTGETMPDTSFRQPSSGGGGGGRSSPTIYSPTYGPTYYVNNTYITIEPSDKSQDDKERSQEGEIEQPKESGMKGITGSVVRNLPKANPVIGILIVVIIVASGVPAYIYICKGTDKKN